MPPLARLSANPARLITLEGADGVGKSTQTNRLVARLKTHGIDAIATREVGGCPQAETLRDVWLRQENGYWDPWAEVLIVMAARREHWVRTIAPAIARGCWVVCDRFIDSTRVYQGLAGGLGLDAINRLWQQVVPNCEPDLTLVLDLPIESAQNRLIERGDRDRFQERGTPYALKLREAWHILAAQEPERIKIIDASGTAETVTERLWRVLYARSFISSSSS